MGKQILEEGPESHQVKRGTPTMGGLLIIAVVLGLFFAMAGGQPPGGIIAPLATLLLVGILGAFDDWLNARTGEGISARQKMLWLVVVAAFAAYQIQTTYAIDSIAVPFVGSVTIHPAVYMAFAAFAIIASANGVNITDGLDGLAGGTLVFAFVAFVFVSLLNVPTQPNLALLCALIVGALLGFLWFNVHPAQLFMGDSGSLALGATLAVTALITGQILILPLVGLVFVIETLSVIIQVISFRGFGRRIFRMSPVHHHFELAGWPEFTVIVRFWIIAGLCVAVGLGVFYADFITRGGLG
jgi:phospho-N-acetylmuramoyl-pentapeptide-transferase